MRGATVESGESPAPRTPRSDDARRPSGRAPAPSRDHVSAAPSAGSSPRAGERPQQSGPAAPVQPAPQQPRQQQQRGREAERAPQRAVAHQQPMQQPVPPPALSLADVPQEQLQLELLRRSQQPVPPTWGLGADSHSLPAHSGRPSYASSVGVSLNGLMGTRAQDAMSALSGISGSRWGAAWPTKRAAKMPLWACPPPKARRLAAPALGASRAAAPALNVRRPESLEPPRCEEKGRRRAPLAARNSNESQWAVTSPPQRRSPAQRSHRPLPAPAPVATACCNNDDAVARISTFYAAVGGQAKLSPAEIWAKYGDEPGKLLRRFRDKYARSGGDAVRQLGWLTVMQREDDEKLERLKAFYMACGADFAEPQLRREVAAQRFASRQAKLGWRRRLEQLAEGLPPPLAERAARELTFLPRLQEPPPEPPFAELLAVVRQFPAIASGESKISCKALRQFVLERTGFNASKETLCKAVHQA